MDVLRTPDERFDDLPGYDFAPHWLEVTTEGEDGSLRVHHLDEGPADGPVVLALHGEPTWSYLYRTVVPPLVQAGCRVVVPDLVGFGRSDKPASRTAYTYARHVDWVRQVLEARDLSGITLLGQDWGGLIGLRLVAEHPERFAAVVAANTGLPDGRHRMSDAWYAFRDYAATTPEFSVSRMVAGATTSDVPADVLAAYDAPFPDEGYKEGVRAFPALIPTEPDDPGAVANRAAWQQLARWDAPFVCAYSDRDPITAGGDGPFRKLVPGAQGREHPVISGAGHFLQEDAGPELAAVVARVVAEVRG
ncbi:haloalkane dehalogenase [Rhodococcus aerolatus]